MIKDIQSQIFALAYVKQTTRSFIKSETFESNKVIIWEQWLYINLCEIWMELYLPSWRLNTPKYKSKIFIFLLKNVLYSDKIQAFFLDGIGRNQKLANLSSEVEPIVGNICSKLFIFVKVLLFDHTNRKGRKKKKSRKYLCYVFFFFCDQKIVKSL